MPVRQTRAILLASALGLSAAAGGLALAGGAHGVRVVAIADVPTGYFPALTTDALGRPIYSVTYGDLFDSATLTRITVLRHLDGTWHLIDLPGAASPTTSLRFVPTLGLTDGVNIVEPGRYVPIPPADLGLATDLAGSPIDLAQLNLGQSTWRTALGMVTVDANGFALASDGGAPQLLAHFPTEVTNPDGIRVSPTPGLINPAADADGHLFVAMVDANLEDAHGYLLVHFPGDGPDAWTQVGGFYAPSALPLNDGSGHVWLANTGALRDIVFD